MPIQHAIWKVGDKTTPLTTSRLASEHKLEEMIVTDPRILSGYERTAAGTIFYRHQGHQPFWRRRAEGVRGFLTNCA